MGLDLRLLPFDADFFSHTVLSCERRSDLFGEILTLENGFGRDVPGNFKTFTARHQTTGETCYGITTRTLYGNNLRYVSASGLLEFAQHKEVTDNELNRAIWAYLGCLSPDTKVALYWH